MRLERMLKSNEIIQSAYVRLGSLFFRAITPFLKTDRKQVMFCSLIGRSFGDSPRVLFDAMKVDPRFDECVLVWAFDDPSMFDVDGAEVVKLNSFGYFVKLLQSGVWVNNVNAARSLRIKPESTIYLNTWHGAGVVKVDGNSQPHRNDYDYSDVDFMCCSGDYEKSIHIRDFKVRPNAFHMCGMPRNDRLYDVTKADGDGIKRLLGIETGKKAILYAPTWRGYDMSALRFPIDIPRWKEELSDEYVLLYRAHHLAKRYQKLQFDDFFIDVSTWPDANSLLPAIDVLISDYSTISFDYSILERPLYIYAYDYEEYSKERGFYRDISEVFRGCVFHDEKSLLERLKRGPDEMAIEMVKRIKAENLPPVGEATSRCLDYLAEKISNESRKADD